MVKATVVQVDGLVQRRITTSVVVWRIQGNIPQTRNLERTINGQSGGSGDDLPCWSVRILQNSKLQTTCKRQRIAKWVVGTNTDVFCCRPDSNIVRGNIVSIGRRSRIGITSVGISIPSAAMSTFRTVMVVLDSGPPAWHRTKFAFPMKRSKPRRAL